MVMKQENLKIVQQVEPIQETQTLDSRSFSEVFQMIVESNLVDHDSLKDLIDDHKDIVSQIECKKNEFEKSAHALENLVLKLQMEVSNAFSTKKYIETKIIQRFQNLSNSES